MLCGVGPGRFGPQQPNTRPKMAVVLGRLMRWAGQPATASAVTGMQHFRDGGRMPAWASRDVSLAAARGILRGGPRGNFHPGEAVTWAQAVVLARAHHYPPAAPSRVAGSLAQLPHGAATPQLPHGAAMPPRAVPALAEDAQAGGSEGPAARAVPAGPAPRAVPRRRPHPYAERPGPGGRHRRDVADPDAGGNACLPAGRPCHTDDRRRNGSPRWMRL